MKKKLSMLIGSTMMIVANAMATFATGGGTGGVETGITIPGQAEVGTVASQGMDYFFGALSGLAVIFGGVNFYQAFLAKKNTEDEDGDGMSQSKMSGKIVQGVMCIIAAVIIFAVRAWVKNLFNI